MPRKALHWSQYPRRFAVRDHVCCICGETILQGGFYVDGGNARKAHTECADVVEAIRNGG